MCHQYFFKLLVLLEIQLATGATGLYSQGATAVVQGWSIHALGPIIGEFTGGVAHCGHQALPQQCWN